MSDTKLTNPKDAIGIKKIDMGLVPDTTLIGLAKAFMEGALKYGRFNWRIAGVRASVYNAAHKRHMAKWWNGQNEDPQTRVHHLDNAMACIAILRDAELYGKLTDDRPPCPDPDAMARAIDAAADGVVFLQETFKDHLPYQYTIADTRPNPLDAIHDGGLGAPSPRVALAVSDPISGNVKWRARLHRQSGRSK